VEGKKAFILPTVAALLLAAWWVFKPASQDAPPNPDTLETVIDREVGGAVKACLDATPEAEVRSVVAVVSGAPGGKAVVDQLAFEPAELPPALRSCLLRPVGMELSAPAPEASVRRTLHPSP
jgi:hypothetical protein